MSRTVLPNRRPHFLRLIKWGGVHWNAGVGLDPEGVAVELFIDIADPEAVVDEAIIRSVHEASITVSHLLQHGVRAADHAARLAGQAPGYLALGLIEAAKVEAEEGERVRALETWRAERIATGAISVETLEIVALAYAGAEAERADRLMRECLDCPADRGGPCHCLAARP